jgi:GAF domain-containing protein
MDDACCLQQKADERVRMQNQLADPGGEAPAVVRKRGLDEPAKRRALQAIASQASLMARTEMAMVTVLDEETQWYVARVGLEGEQSERKHSFCHYTMLKPGEPMIISDARQDPRFANSPLVVSGPRIRFYAGVPLIDTAGYALGALCVADTHPRADFRHTMGLVELARQAERVICG